MFNSVFFGDPFDTFADFFKCVYGWHGNPYQEGYANYPALAIMMYKFCYHFIGGNVDVSNGLEYRNIQAAWLVFILYNLVIIWITCISLSHKLRLDDWGKNLFYCVIMMSFPVMFSLERGNQISLAFAFTAFFVAFYDDENIILKEISYISLAIAASLKIYPAIFGFLLVREKKYKECVRLIIYGLLFFFLPFFYYGRGALSSFVTSLLSFMDSQGLRYGYNFSLVNILNFFSEFLGCHCSSIVIFIISICILGGIILGVIVYDSKWKRLLCFVLLLILIPQISDSYMLLFMILPFVDYLNEFDGDYYKRKKKEKLFFAIIFLLLFVPWGMPVLEKYTVYGYLVSYSYIIYWLDILILSLYILVDVVYRIVIAIRKRKIIKMYSDSEHNKEAVTKA